MSLINEALKKAQHQRTGSALDAPPMPGGGSAAHRGSQGMPKGTLVLLLAGAAVVVVISVVATVYFVNRAPVAKVALTPVATLPVSVAAKPAPLSAPTDSPVIIAPVIFKAPSPVVEAPVAAPVAASTASSSPSAQPKDEPRQSSQSDGGQPAPPQPVVEGSLADRIADFVDKARVTGIRASDTGSKVLMNDKVYRVNDVVNRNLGLRLVKIESDSLTFADANNATYVKNF